MDQTNRTVTEFFSGHELLGIFTAFLVVIACICIRLVTVCLTLSSFE
uniref:Uncharacterized protein n=1 Tax=Anguilla anguilla TaxID=7936 RepID=A0A0E9QXU1_ANGAN